MTRSPVKLNFQQYLTYDHGTDNRYELVNEELLQITPASPELVAIIRFLFLQFYGEILRQNLDWEVFSSDVGICTVAGSSRLSDVCIMTKESWKQLRLSNLVSAVLED